MLPIHIALVSELRESDLSFSEVAAVAAALDKQVTRDFGPIWNVEATVNAFTRLEDVPEGYLLLLVREEIGNEGALGVHRDDSDQVFALVEFRWDWPLWASHECLEMLADPTLSRMVAGESPKEGQGRVEFLVEVCDPCQAAEQAYRVNELRLSDFVTPRYYDPVTNPGTRCSFHGGVIQPHQVLPGGYLSWRTPDGHLWQADFQSAEFTILDLGPFPTHAGAGGLRSLVDQRTPTKPVPEDPEQACGRILQRARDRRAEKVHTFRRQLAALDAKAVRGARERGSKAAYTLPQKEEAS